ncbi:Maltose permease MAL31 [Fusarium oxysporum f. sp. albedinis]|nr:Maltose permease MAL31 [Fusarium oxysporum f. sp. albedinis]
MQRESYHIRQCNIMLCFICLRNVTASKQSTWLAHWYIPGAAMHSSLVELVPLLVLQVIITSTDCWLFVQFSGDSGAHEVD